METTTATASRDAARVPVVPSAVDEFLAVDPRSLGGAALRERLCALEVVIRRAQAAQADAVAEFTARDCADADGSPSTACWLQQHTGASEREARGTVAFARTVGRLPVMADALRAGDVSAGHLRVLAAQSRHLATALVAEAEPFLTETARRLDSASYVTAVSHWVATAAPARHEADTQRKYDSRWLSFSPTFRGMGSIQGMLDPEGAVVVGAALDAMVANVAAGDTRTKDQRRADALVELVELARSHELVPGTGAHRPEVVVHATADTAAGVPGAPPAMLAEAVPLVPKALERIACDATWRRLVLDALGVPLELGRATRGVPASLRKFVALRDGHCRYPGCARGAAYCEVHHVVHWSRGGPTDAANLALLCRYHHHLVHERGHAIALDRSGGLTVTRPDGTVLSAMPRGPTPVPRT